MFELRNFDDYFHGPHNGGSHTMKPPHIILGSVLKNYDVHFH